MIQKVFELGVSSLIVLLTMGLLVLLVGVILDFLFKKSNPFIVALIALAIFFFTVSAFALDCYSDEPRVYKVSDNLPYFELTEHHTGSKKGIKRVLKVTQEESLLMVYCDTCKINFRRVYAIRCFK